MICPRCKGTGFDTNMRDECPECLGLGKIEEVDEE